MYKIYTEKLGISPGFIHNIWLIMRLTTVILIATLMQVSAAGLAQKINLSKSNVSLKAVLKEIRTQSGYDFVYAEEIFDVAKPVNIQIKDAELDEVLNEIFKNQPLTFSISKTTVTIKPKDPTFLERVVATLTNTDASGRVVDSENKPLPGASVKIKKTGKAVSTDKDGKFFLRGVEEGAVLVVSFIGYLPKEVNASTNMGNVVLEVSDSKLDEVQVIAYGTTTRRLSTGNIGTVKAEDIERQPVNNPLLALQGRVPGVFIEQYSGSPGSAVKVRIQGQNSIAKGNDPLYVIDGIPYSAQLLPSSGVYSIDILNGGSPMSFINPSDIESIDVLKDADATAIYGSRAANGAILITTKKGKVGELKIDVNIQSGIGKVAKQVNMLNSTQYLEMRHEALKNNNLEVSPTDYDINGQWDTTRYTNWQKDLIGGTSRYQNFQASASGGSITTQFLVGANYHRETTVIPGDFADTKGAVHFNLISSSNNKKFKIQLGGNYLVDNNCLPSEDPTLNALQQPPTAPNLYNADGGLNWSQDSSGNSTFINPLSFTYNRFTSKTNNLISNAILNYEILPGLAIKSTLGYTNLQTNDQRIYPSLASQPEIRELYNTRYASSGNNNIKTWNIEPQVSYNRKIKKGILDVLLGATLQDTKRSSLQLIGAGQLNDDILADFKAASYLAVTSTLEEIYKYTALFGRLNYRWNDKYIVNLNVRRDGSSRFGNKNLFHNFGSIAGAWIFSQEKAIQDHLSFISYGKLRVSYGTTGNDQIGEYQFLSTYKTINSLPYQGVLGLKPDGLANPYIEWEETRKLQSSIDLGFLNDRILFSANYSFNRSSNQLVNAPLSSFAGFLSISTNLPAVVQNSGWEFSLSTVNINRGKFSWNTNFNMTLQKNKLAAFPGLAESSYANSYFIGKPTTVQRIFNSVGVDPLTGAYQFLDKKGNPTFTPADADRTVLVDENPTFYGGLQNGFKYKGFGLDFLFQFVKQKTLGVQLGLFPGAIKLNQLTSVLSRWQKEGDLSNVQKFDANFSLSEQANDAYQSDANWADASYIRLKNLSVSWQLPKHLINTLRLNNCRLYIQGQNLITFTKYKGLDPEIKSMDRIPPLRVITFGLNVSF